MVDLLKLAEAAKAVKQARDIPGKVPTYHFKIMAKHRREWPVLWEAIDNLCRTLEEGEWVTNRFAEQQVLSPTESARERDE